MKIYPAIDLINGTVVRLTQGSFGSTKTYATDPIAVARGFAKAGAEFLHVIDLDGAKRGAPAQTATIAAIIGATNMRLQVGGGIHTLSAAQDLFEAGAERVIIGSLAVKDRESTASLLKTFGPERVTLALDCQKCHTNFPVIALDGWQTESSLILWDLLDHYLSLGATRILCTDIDRDGTLQGSNHNLYSSVLNRYPGLNLQASGGIASLNELGELAAMGLESCVIGKSLYEGSFTLKEALTTVGVSC